MSSTTTPPSAPHEDHDGAGPHHLRLRTLTADDYDDVKSIMDMVYPMMLGGWTRKQYDAQLKRFPEGQLCIEDNGRVVAVAQALIVDYARFGDKHSYDAITGRGLLTTHTDEGDTLYGMDMFVHPDYRGMRLGRRLYDARKELCEKWNLRRMITGGRIPGFAKHAGEMTVQQYIQKVRNSELRDPVLSFQLANDFHVRRVIKDYIPEDHESRGYATLLEWNNIYHEREQDETGYLPSRKSVIRVGAVQWQMRRVRSEQDLLDQVEYFVDAFAGYNADFVLLPEFFNGPLMGESNDRTPAGAIRHLASHTVSLRDAIQEMAISYNINIIAGSMPLLDGDAIYNVSYLCRRDGTWASQSKLHITPDEKAYWGLRGGNELRVFDTDVARVGVLICYDVEFPELSRLLSEQGLQVLFVPFWTDTQNAYLRVRRCAQARAIENECYVVITGSVGNLPRVENMDIQYSQAAVFSPADFSFAHDAIIAEATPNTEMTLISDLDLDLLKDLHFQGSVRNLKERRTEMYEVRWTGELPVSRAELEAPARMQPPSSDPGED
ncbi:MAG: bifunctional GNAT family N-acetyltransferase/carbon-nitrogen hydrolase family protein [Myxococcales bacterium]|jgi:predicted amidohydrolase/GNAT superfamily N-acetyltransferase